MDNKYNKFHNWLTNVLSVEFPETVKAICFNLYEDEGSCWSIELVGAGSFDEEDEDWACDEVFTTRDDTFTIQHNGSWDEVQEMFSCYIIQYLEKGRLAEQLKKYKAVAVGFVDGDIAILYKSGEECVAHTMQSYEVPKVKQEKFYELRFDVKLYEKAEKKKENIISVDETNVDEIEYEGFKKGFFNTCELVDTDFSDWPNVEFYYASQKADKGLDFLWNIHNWPVIHKRVMNRLDELGVTGIKYYPIKLVEQETGAVNADYVFMHIRNFIEAYDMEKSKYTYFEEYDLYNFLPNDIVLDKIECSKYDIFRCKRNSPTIYISERVRDEIITNGWTGFAIKEVR